MATEFEHPPGNRASRSEGNGMGMIVAALTIGVLGAVLYFAFVDRMGPAQTGTSRTSIERTLPQTTSPPGNTTSAPTASPPANTTTTPTTPAPSTK